MNPYKVGDKVVCVNISGRQETSLELHGVYEVLLEVGTNIRIECGLFHHTRFILYSTLIAELL